VLNEAVLNNGLRKTDVLNEAVLLPLMYRVCRYKENDVLNEAVLKNDVLKTDALNEAVLLPLMYHVCVCVRIRKIMAKSSGAKT
jgi:hypothetical protein